MEKGSSNPQSNQFDMNDVPAQGKEEVEKDEARLLAERSMRMPSASIDFTSPSSPSHPNTLIDRFKMFQQAQHEANAKGTNEATAVMLTQKRRQLILKRYKGSYVTMEEQRVYKRRRAKSENDRGHVHVYSFPKPQMK